MAHGMALRSEVSSVLNLLGERNNQTKSGGAGGAGEGVSSIELAPEMLLRV